LPDSKAVSAELVSTVYRRCFGFAASILGNKKSGELLQSGYKTILQYFHSLQNFSVTEDWHLQINCEEISENDLLAFAVWMQQFIRELKNFVVGIGNLDIRMLTEEVSEELEQSGFYEYYRQAQELEY